MLFRVYSRFVPNLTRNDGLAFAGLVNAHMGGQAKTLAQPSPSAGDASLQALQSLSPEEIAGLLALLKKAS
jgi:integrase